MTDKNEKRKQRKAVKDTLKRQDWSNTDGRYIKDADYWRKLQDREAQKHKKRKKDADKG